jgi:hypothetical protein
MSKQEARPHAKALVTEAPDPDIPDVGAAVAAARPKVKQLLAEYQDDPDGDAGAIVEALMLNQLSGEPARAAEALRFHQVQDLYHALEVDSGRSATRLKRRNRHLKGELDKKDLAHAYVRHYLEQVKTAARSGREPTQAEIIEKISTAIGLRGPLVPRVETGRSRTP